MRLFCFGVFAAAALIPGTAHAQSTDQAFPTPITTNEISGVIRARDIGDPRLTTYFFAFDGNRGDVFINVVTSNLNGDIDVFAVEGMKPKTKITIYADNPQNETGRVIYLRRPQKLILRIQGRSPNDDPAVFRLKFAGSFAPLTGAVARNAADIFSSAVRDDGGAVTVNSVGTIIETEPVRDKPEPRPAEVEVVAGKHIEGKNAKKTENRTDAEAAPEDLSRNEVKAAPANAREARRDEAREDVESDKPRVIVTDLLERTPPPPEDAEPKAKEPASREITVELKEKGVSAGSTIVTIEKVPVDPEEVEPKKAGKEAVTGKTETAKTPDPLASVFLRVELKNGDKFIRPMTEVISVNVIRGVLTIVTIDGKVLEFDILDVLKMSIE